MDLENKSYNELRSLASEHGLGLKHPSKDELIEALEDVDLEDSNDPEPEEPEQQETEDSTGDSEGDDQAQGDAPAADFTPSGDAPDDATMIDGMPDVLELDESDVESVEQPENDEKSDGNEGDKDPSGGGSTPTDTGGSTLSDKQAGQIQIAINKVLRGLWPRITGKMPKKLDPEQTEKMGAEAKEALDLLIPDGWESRVSNGSGLMVAAAPHAAALKNAEPIEELESDESGKQDAQEGSESSSKSQDVDIEELQNRQLKD